MFDAADRALNAIALLRAFWSLFVTTGRWTVFGGMERPPLGVIHTGPVYTLHLPDGTLVPEDVYWFDWNFTGDRPLYDRSEDWPRIEQLRRWAMRRLARLPHRQDVEALLIRYAHALDDSNTDIAFLHLWGILEKLTDTVGARYDETIRRAVWATTERDRPVVKDMLEAVRLRRNQYVHAGMAGYQSDQIAHVVKSVVDPHLFRLISNPWGCATVEEYAQYLALPANPETLDRERRMRAKVLRVKKKRA